MHSLVDFNKLSGIIDNDYLSQCRLNKMPNLVNVMGQKLGPLKVCKNYSISSRVCDRLDEYAEKVGIWKSRIVELALNEYIDKMELAEKTETKKVA